MTFFPRKISTQCLQNVRAWKRRKREMCGKRIISKKVLGTTHVVDTFCD
jgi:hypothetical protein